jgi:hypothetical protein
MLALHLINCQDRDEATNLKIEGIIIIIIIDEVRPSPFGTAATIGLLYQPQIIDDYCGAVGGMRTCRGNQVVGENLPQCHFVHHKSHMT